MTARRRYLTVDPAVFLDGFPERHFRVGHTLVGHPLLSLDRLLDLARRLPAPLVEYNGGDVQVCQDPATTPRTGLSLEETVRHIDTCGSWVALKYVEYDPAYRQLLHDCIAEVADLARQRRDGLHQLECYIFISSPGAVTPFHFDDEHNFLLQVQGWKTMHVWHRDSPGAVTAADIELSYTGAARNLPYRPAVESPDDVYTLSPGQGLHVPVHTPHWVRVGDQVSVSFSVTFRSRALAREAAVHWVNGRLRRRGLEPRPYGDSAAVDWAKFMAARLARRAARLRRY
ncbi:MAG: transcription factor [Hyphomicrobiales bacterium]|nr:transcription factor [Hyphomicrobiales bacterium]MCP5371540.1 transcription factor [Hyphomicrobiales bacterium]